MDGKKKKTNPVMYSTDIVITEYLGRKNQLSRKTAKQCTPKLAC